MRWSKSVPICAALFSLLTLLSACKSYPVQIVSSTSRGKQAKFLYYQRQDNGFKTGIIRCTMAKGDLTNCQDVVINLNDK